MNSRTGLVFSWVFLLAFAVGPGGDAQGQGDLFFDAVDVEIVNVEVVVTDNDDQPVRGLAREDFEVLEDGEPVELTNFYVVEPGGGPPAASAEEAVAALPGAAVPAHTDHLQMVILFDDAHTDPRNRRRVLTALEEFLPDQWRKEDRIMLARLDQGVDVLHPFTHDVGQILYVLEELAKKQGSASAFEAEYQAYLSQLDRAHLSQPPDPATIGGVGAIDGQGLNKQHEFEASIETARGLAMEATALAERWQQRVILSSKAISELVASMAGLPGRKALVMVSDGLPVHSNSVTSAWLAKYENWIFSLPGYASLGPGQESLQFEMSRLRSSRFYSNVDLDALIAEASANQVVFYPLSAARIGSGHVSAEYAGSAHGSGSGPRSLEVTSMDRLDREASLLDLAEGTGGFALTNTANVDRLISRVTRDFDHFYSLGYRLDREVDEKLHRIEVHVKRPDVKVRHLKRYRRKDAVDELKDLAISALRYEAGENTLGVRLEPGVPVKKERNRFQVPVKVAIPFRSILLLPEDDHHSGRLVLVVGARDEKGNLSPIQQVELPIRIPNDQLSQVREGAAFYPLEMTVGKGKQLIAIGIRDRLAKVNSTVRLELDVGAEVGG